MGQIVVRSLFISNFKKLTLLLTSLLVLVCFEGGFRVNQFGIEGILNFEKYNPQDGFFKDFRIVSKNPVLQWEIRPLWKGYFKGQWTEFNSDGFRSEEFSKIAATGVNHIAVFGRSETMGPGIEKNDIWAESVARGLGAQLFNFSTYGYSMYQVEELIRLYTEKYPIKNIIVPLYFHEWEFPIQKKINSFRFPFIEVNNPIEKWLSYFYSYSWAKLEVSIFSQKYLSSDWNQLVGGNVDQRRFTSVSQIVPRIISWCRQKKINLSLVFLPRPFFDMKLSEFQNRNTIVSSLAHYPGINFVFADLISELPKQPEDMIYNGEFHPKAHFHKVVSDYILTLDQSKRIVNAVDNNAN